MNFTWTTLHVTNMEKSLSFYQEIIGLPLKRRFSPNGIMELAFLGNEGESEIELICEPNNKKVNNEGLSMGFTDKRTIEEIIEIIKKSGYKVLSPVLSPNSHIRFIYVNDPDGYKIQLIQKLK